MIVAFNFVNWKGVGSTLYVETSSKAQLTQAFETGTTWLGFDIRRVAKEFESVPPKVWELTNPWIHKNWVIPDEDIHNPDLDHIDGPDHWIQLYVAIAKLSSPGFPAEIVKLSKVEVRADAFMED